MEKPPNSPPPLPLQPAVGAVQVILSLALVLFLADGLLCLADESLKLVFQASWLTPVRGLVGLAAFFGGLSVYALSGLTPLVPKRYFLPLTLLPFAVALCQFPLLVIYYRKSQEIAWGISLAQILFTLCVIFRLQRHDQFHWPLVPSHKLGKKVFSVWNLCGFIGFTLFLLVPAGIAIAVSSTCWVISHVSEGFVSVRPAGVVMQARTYHRESDGATIRLVPMSHIADGSFYTQLVNSLPEDALILAEGVSDRKNELKSKISYSQMATNLGLAEQHSVFKPKAKSLPADVDLSELSPPTLTYLREIMTLHSKGITAENLPALLESTPPHLVESLLEDILYSRNRHLLQVLETQLASSKNIIIPWGAAHMPGISAGIRKIGFVQVGSEEHIAIPFSP